MILVRLEGYDFKYDLGNILRLFYKNETIEFIETEPPVEYGGIFVFCTLTRRGDAEYDLKTEIWEEHVRKLLKTDVISLAGSEPYREKTDKKKEFTRQLKSEMNRCIYLALVQYTGKEQPWGMLTGIRPAKIVHEMLENGYGKKDIFSKLEDFYHVSVEKAEVLYDVAATERDILDRTPDDSIGLYIGIPFCPSRCLYCSFTSNPVGKYKKQVQTYLDTLKYEIVKTNEIIRQNAYKIQSIYIGGGTPTSLNAMQLEELLKFIEGEFPLDNLEEYSLEAGRPDSIQEDKLEAIKNSRVDRISINPQTMNEATLRLIGRQHTVEDVITTFKLARSMGFSNINMDVIVGLPGENHEMFENTLKQISQLRPEDLTVHTLAVKRASRLNENREEYPMISDEEASEMISMAHDYAKHMGMHPYYLYRQKNMAGNLENIGYCKPGFESIYNVQIMEEKQTIIALGAGAITKVVFPGENRLERAFNVKSVEDYIGRIDEMVERKRALLS